MPTPEEIEPEIIATLLNQAGRFIQDTNQVNLFAVRGIVFRNFSLEKGHGFEDYLF